MFVRMLIVFYFLCPLLLVGQEEFLDENYIMADTMFALELLREADLLISKGKEVKALSKVYEAKDIFAAVLGAESSRVTNCWLKIGDLYYTNNDLLTAIATYDSLLVLYIKVSGEEHPNIAHSYNKLGMAYAKLDTLKAKKEVYEPPSNPLAKALEYHKKALKIFQQTKEDNFINIGRTYNFIGTVVGLEGDYISAADYHGKALEIQLESLDSFHIDVAKSYSQLGQAYKKQRLYKEAGEHFNKALGICNKTFEKGHPETANQYFNVAGIYEVLDSTDMAIDNYEIGLRILHTRLKGKTLIRSKVKNYTRLIVRFSGHLYALYAITGKENKAERAFKKTLNTFLKILDKDHPAVGSCYFNLGFFYQIQNRYDEAIRHYELAFQSYTGGKALYDPDILSIFPTRSAKFYAQGETLFNYLEEGRYNLDSTEINSLIIYLKESEYNKNPSLLNHFEGNENAVQCWYWLGKMYRIQENIKTGKMASAIALILTLKRYGEHHPRLIKFYNNLGLVLYKQSHHKSIAIPFLKKAINLHAPKSERDKAELAKVYNNLGWVEGGAYSPFSNEVNTSLRYEKALTISLNLRQLYQPNLISYYNNLAGSYFGRTDDILGKRLYYYEKALKKYISVYGQFRPKEFVELYLHLSIAHNAYRRKEEQKAKEYYKKAEKLFSDLSSKFNYEILQHYNRITYSFIKGIKYNEIIISWYKNLKKINVDLYGEYSLQNRKYYSLLGHAYRTLQNHDKAIFFYKKAWELQYKLPYTCRNYYHKGEGYVILNITLGGYYKAQKEYVSAEFHFKKALEHLSEIPRKRLSKLRYIKKICIPLGDLYLTQGRDDDARQCFNKVVSMNLGHVSLAYEPSKYFRKMNAEQFLGVPYIKDYGDFNRKWDDYESTGGDSFLKDAFEIAEGNKSIALHNAMKETRALYSANIPNNFKEQEMKLREDIVLYEKLWYEKSHDKLTTRDSMVNLVSHCFYLRYKHRELKRRIFEKYEVDGNVRESINIEELQQMLDPKETLLEFVVRGSSIFIFVINKKEVKTQKIDIDEAKLNSLVRAFRKANQHNQFKKMTREYCYAAHKLYRNLIAPIVKNLKEEVIIVPDGILNYIPFGALLVEPVTDVHNWKDHPYWLKDKHISYCQSATLLKEMKEKAHKKQPPKNLIAFAPFYDGDTTLLAHLFPLADSAERISLSPLLATGEEVYGIREITGGDVYYHEEATEDQFTKVASDGNILHLASHGSANDKFGEYCFLAFTEQKDSIENELLYVRDLYNLQLNADMVVLSACETGVGELRRGEGFISLAQGFIYAGAKSIITSLWAVNDESTKDLMIGFYKHLKTGMDKDAALRQAKLDYIEGADISNKAHPFFWAAFIGHGDMKPIPFDNSEKTIVQKKDKTIKAAMPSEHSITFKEKGLSTNKAQVFLSLEEALLKPEEVYIMDLRYNRLTTLPESIGQFSNLETLNLSGVKLTSLPESIGNLYNLETLNLSESELTSLPESIGNLFSLETLNLSRTKLTSFPESIEQLSNLKTLNLSEAGLTSLSESIGDLSSLKRLDLSNNQLISLPDCIGQISGLNNLDLSNNELTSLPESIGQLSKLFVLDLSNNKLTSLPESIGQISWLRSLRLASNKLTSLPESVGQISGLNNLDLSNNELTNLPESIGQLSRLLGLSLATNQLTSLPESIGQLSKLQGLDLSRNQLASLPKSIGKFSKLVKLSLSRNPLTNLPISTNQLPRLRELYIHEDQFSNEEMLSAKIRLSPLCEISTNEKVYIRLNSWWSW